MAYINQRLNEVQAWGGDSDSLPPTEDVVFRIDSVKQEPSSQKGTLMLNLGLTVMEPPSIAGKTARASFVVAPDAKEGSRKRLKALIEATLIQLDQQGGFSDEDLIGRFFMGDVINEPYQKTDAVTGQTTEKMQARIQNERPVQAAPVTQQFQPQAAAGYPGAQQPQGVHQEQPPQQGYAQNPPAQQAPVYQQQPPQGGYVQPAVGGQQPYTGPVGAPVGAPAYAQVPGYPTNGAAPPAAARLTRPGPVTRV